MTCPPRSVIRASVSVLFAMFIASSPLVARTVGQALPVEVGAFSASSQVVIVTMTNASAWSVAMTDGGVTIFASYTAGGPVIARVPVLPPFVVDLEAGIYPTFNFGGVPPGTYFIAMVSGVVAAPSIPVSAWRPVVVSGGCSGPPGIGFVNRDLGAESAGSVRLFMGSGDGCATTMELEAGTTPGSSNLGTVTNLGQLLVAATPPPGHYYVRARGRNAFGVGPYSSVLPVSVPACASEPVGWLTPAFVTVTVVGGTVTLSWAPALAPAGFPVTFYELLLYSQRVGSQPVPTVLLPATATSLSGTVPAGNYVVALVAGNACGKSDTADGIAITVP